MIAIITAVAVAVFLLDAVLVFYNWHVDSNRGLTSFDDVIGMEDRPPPGGRSRR
jgi:hypothetical protein